MWTAYDTNGVEKIDFRLLHVYTSEKRANSNVDGDNTEGSGPNKRAKHKVGASQNVSFPAPAPANQSTFRQRHGKNYDSHTVDSRYGHWQQFSSRSPVHGKHRYSKLNPRHRSSHSRVSSLLAGPLIEHNVDPFETEKQTSGTKGDAVEVKKGDAVEDDKRDEAPDVVRKSESGSSSVTQPTSNTKATASIFRDDLKDFEDDEHFGLGNMSGLSDFTFSTSFDASDVSLLGDRAEAFSSERQKQSCRRYSSFPSHQQLGQYPHHQYHQQQQQHRVQNCQQLEALLHSTHLEVLTSIRSISPLEQGRFLSMYSEWGKMVSRFPLQEYPRSWLGQHPPAQQSAYCHGSVQYPRHNPDGHQQQLMRYHHHHHHAQRLQPYQHQQQDPYATPPRYPTQERRPMPKPVPKKDSRGRENSNKQTPRVLVKEEEQEQAVESGCAGNDDDSSLLSTLETEKVAEV
eukprot:CAMPEP_0113471930 /NCGR_PEP_ID=MMETSP0014_2-20120614/17242_1 /TAXON_ID=2857 /ORGANISM="Nitzschia sp." /LENGTH=456 /DNA_ID=CAMNT_0000364601 /DNA_START=854 /DNA_END=2224 /DNA_ORIENTATION=- /assembly_acc=CAM_ASM_000159